MMDGRELSAGFVMNVPAFCNGSDGAVLPHDLVVILVDLDADESERQSADAIASGYRYVASFGLRDGEPCVQIEPGFEAAMAYAGVAIASLLGTRLKAHQLHMKERLQGEKVTA